jgi:hypothetical protein
MASCTITFTYTPSPSAISETAMLTVSDNAPPGTQTVMLSGTGAVVTATLTPASLNFGSVAQGIASAPMTANLAASVSIGLNITSIVFTGTNAKDFAEKDNCGTMVPADSSCTITITFTPSLGGNTMETASLVVTDNAATLMQIVTLTGIGLTPTTSFTLAAAPGAGTSVSIIPGDTARFRLVLNPSASSVGTVTFTASSNAPFTRFVLTPANATLSGATPIALQVDFQTNCLPGLLAPRGPARPPNFPPVAVALWLLALLALALTRRLVPQARLARVVPALALLLLAMTWASCGGSGLPAGDPPLFPNQPTTPSGLYTITVTATSGPVTSTINLMVRVM